MNKKPINKASEREEDTDNVVSPAEGEATLTNEIKNAHASGDGSIGRNDIDIDKDGTIEISK